MSKSYRYTPIAVVGWLVCSSLTYAQEEVSPTLENQPVAPIQQENDSAGNKDNDSQKQPEAERLTPALNQIESAIRDMVPPKDEAKDQRQEDRDEADLHAQEDMALWAKRMFVATVASVAVTLAGLALIARTLHYTRIAADYTKGMLTEAKATTTAAVDAADSAKKSAELQEASFLRLERPYLHIKFGEIEYLSGHYGEPPYLQMTFVNFGKSPAVLHSYSVRLQNAPEFPLRMPLHCNKNWYEVIEPTKTLLNQINVPVEGAQHGTSIDGKERGGLVLYVIVRYGDQMNAIHTDSFCLRGSPEAFVSEGGTEYNWRKTEYPTAKEETTA